MAALHGARERLQADVVGAAVAAEGDELVVAAILPRLQGAEGGLTPQIVAEAFSKALWMKQSFQAVYG